MHHAMASAKCIMSHYFCHRLGRAMPAQGDKPMILWTLAQVVIVPPPCAPTDYGCRMAQAQQSAPNLAQGDADRAVAREAEARADVAKAQARRAYLAERVGALVADGKCDEARKIALRGGDFGLARQVKEACEPSGN